MIKITLPDGSVKEFEKNTTPMEVAKSISEGLARNVISAQFNGDTIETKTPLTDDGSLILYTWNNPEGKKSILAFISAFIGSGHLVLSSPGQINHWPGDR